MLKKKLLWGLAISMVFILCFSVLAFAATDTPAQSIEKIKALGGDYANFIVNNQTQPVFTYSASDRTKTIYEEVFIEVPCDTDGDGKRDVIKIKIIRPAESGVIVNPETGETQITIPVLMEHSPYRNSPAPSNANHNVVHEQKINPEHTPTYEQMQAENDRGVKKPYTYEWYFGDDAMTWKDGKWVPGNDGGWSVPAARNTSTGVVYQNDLKSAQSNPSNYYQYFLVRGVAIVISASIGSNFSEDDSEGFPALVDVEEILPSMAIIKWLNGDPSVKGYTDRTCTTEVKATWCNGNVAMTGQSYVGKMAMGAASSGVEGLKAIIPIAATPAQYNYYRKNGAVIAPFNYQGEDADVMVDYTSGIRNTTKYKNDPELQSRYAAYKAQIFKDQDRDTGDYNEFWDRRNFLTTIDHVKAGVMIMHGFNDWNVQTKNADMYYRALKDHGVPVKEIWHLEAHTTVYGREDSHYMKYYHLWLDHFLYGLDNDAIEKIPEVSLPNGNNVNWEFYDEWPIAGSTRTTFYLDAPGEDKAGALLEEAPEAGIVGTFKDDRVANANINPANTTHLNTWESRLFNPATLDTPSSERLAFATDPLKEPLRLNGTVTVTLELSVDKGKGSIAAALLDMGPGYRGFSTTSTLYNLNSGHGEANIPINNYTINNTLSPYKIVTRSGTDVQNPNPTRETYLNAPASHAYIPEYFFHTKAITPGEKYEYTFEFETMDYTFKAGNRLALFVYSTDYRATIVPDDVTTFTLYAGENSFVELPIVPTNSIFYDPNGATSAYAPLGYSDTYAIEGQSKNALNFQDKLGYRVVSPTTAKFTWSEYPFIGWNTRADNTGTTYMPGDIIPDGALKGNITLYAQWEGQPRSNFQLKTDANLIKAGQYFRMYPHFRDAVATNAATLDFTFDKDIFEYRNFTPAEGVQLLQWTTTADGVKLTVMARDYNVTDFGEVLFSAKEDVDLKDEDNEITVSANYVLKLEDGTKEVKNEIASTVFTTIGGDPDLDLILLSDLIDVFGMKYDHPDWAKYKFYDFNKSGDIDIYDVCEVARRIGQE